MEGQGLCLLEVGLIGAYGLAVHLSHLGIQSSQHVLLVLCLVLPIGEHPESECSVHVCVCMCEYVWLAHPWLAGSLTLI